MTHPKSTTPGYSLISDARYSELRAKEAENERLRALLENAARWINAAKDEHPHLMRPAWVVNLDETCRDRGGDVVMSNDDDPSAEVVIASWQRTADYWATRAKRAEAERDRLAAALGHIVQIADRGATAEQIGRYAFDTLRSGAMSVRPSDPSDKSATEEVSHNAPPD